MANTTIVCVGGDITIVAGQPQCSNGWQIVESILAFDISLLDPAAIVSAFTAGATFCFVPLAMVWAASHVLDMLRGR